MPLELESLRKAVDALGRSLDVAHDIAIQGSQDLRDTVRAGVVQNFEVAYELSWKFIQRWLRVNLSPEDADRPRTRRELFRIAARYRQPRPTGQTRRPRPTPETPTAWPPQRPR